RATVTRAAEKSQTETFSATKRHKTLVFCYYRRQMTKPRVVILGGGFGGLFTALELAGAADISLVSDASHFLFTPMLYEYLSGEVEAWHIAPRYDELIDESVHFVQSAVTGVDLTAQTVALSSREQTLNYDVLVLALGGVSN